MVEELVGPVCSLTDSSEPPSPVAYQGVDAGASSAAAPSSVPLEPGTQVEPDQVTMVYALER